MRLLAALALAACLRLGSGSIGFDALGSLRDQAHRSARPQPLDTFQAAAAARGEAAGSAAHRGARALHGSGSLTHLTYEGPDVEGLHTEFTSASRVREEAVSLDALPFVLGADCSAERGALLRLAVGGVGGELAALAWPPGTLLAGGAQWGCSLGAAAAGKAAPFYLRVTAPPFVLAARGSFLFHGSLDVAAVSVPVERVALTDVFHSLTFALQRRGADLPAAAEPQSEVAEGAAGSAAEAHRRLRSERAAAATAARRAQLAKGTPYGAPNAPGAAVAAAPQVLPAQRWGTQAPVHKETAVTWNVLPGSAGSPFGPTPNPGTRYLNAPYGGHLAACQSCYMWASVDVFVTATFEGGVAQEMEVTASVRQASKFNLDLMVNTSWQDAYSLETYNRTTLDIATGQTVTRPYVNATYMGYMNTGSWAVPLTGQVAEDAGVSEGGDAVDANTTALTTLYFNIQGIPIAVPVTLAMSLNISTAWNSTVSLRDAPATAVVTNSGLSLSGTAVMGARYTGEAGWTPVRGSRALLITPYLPAYDVPAVTAYTDPPTSANGNTATPYYAELAVTLRLLTSVTTTFFADLDPDNALAFTSNFNAYTTISATPSCGSPSRNYTGFRFGPPVSLTNSPKNIFAVLRKGMIASTAVSTSAMQVTYGPACSMAGCTAPATATRVYNLFPGPASALAAFGGALAPGLRGGSLQPLPLTLGPLALLMDETLPGTAYSSGCIPNYKAISAAFTGAILAQWNPILEQCKQVSSPSCPYMSFKYEADPFETDPSAWSASCGGALAKSKRIGGYKYRTVRCRGAVISSGLAFAPSANFIFPQKACASAGTYAVTLVYPDTLALTSIQPRLTSLPCGTLQIYPGSMNFFSNGGPISNPLAGPAREKWNGIEVGCEVVSPLRQGNATFMNFTLPLFDTPSCRWISQLGQWGHTSCTVSQSATLSVCGNDSTCSNCSLPWSLDAKNDGVGADNGACKLVGFENQRPGGLADPWPLTPLSSVRGSCNFGTGQAWAGGVHMPLDGGVVALDPPGYSTYSITVGAANTIMFIVLYSNADNWADKPSAIPQTTDIDTWVSFQRVCSTPLTCAVVSSINPVQTSLPGGTFENGCPLEFDPTQENGGLNAGCLARIITVPLSQSSPTVNLPIEANSRNRAYLNIKYTTNARVSVQGLGWTRASSLDPLSVVHTVPPMEHLFYSYRPASGILGVVLMITQMAGGASGAYPDALLLCRSYEVGQRPAWPRRWEAGLENVVLGMPTLVSPDMLPFTNPATISATLAVVRLISLDLDPSPTDTTGNIVATEQLFTVANTGARSEDFLVQAFDLMPAYGGFPNTLSLLGGSRVAYITTPAETGSRAVNVTLWLQPGGSARACISPGVGTFDFVVCTSASLGRRVSQLTIRESHPAWSAGGMTVTVLAKSEVTFTLTITPFIPLEPGEAATGALPFTGGLMYGGLPDGSYGALERYPSLQANTGVVTNPLPAGDTKAWVAPPIPWPGNIYSSERSAYTALVSSRAQGDTGGEVAAYAGAGATYQRSPPGPSGYDLALKNIDPNLRLGQYFGQPYAPPAFIPPVQISVWGFGSAISSYMGGEYGPQPAEGSQTGGVPGLSQGEDTGGLLFDAGLPNPYASIGGAPTLAPGLNGMRRAQAHAALWNLTAEEVATRLAALRAKRRARVLASIEHPLEDPAADPVLAASGLDLSYLPARKLPFRYTPRPATARQAAAAAAAADAAASTLHPGAARRSLAPGGGGDTPAALALRSVHASPLSHATARSLATAAGASSPPGLTPGLAPIRAYFFARMDSEARLATWVEMYTSGAGCGHPSMGAAEAHLDDFLFLSYGLLACTNLTSIPESGLELLLAVPPNTALRVQVRSPIPGTPGVSSEVADALASGALTWAICSAASPWPVHGFGDTPERNPGMLAGSLVGCSNPSIGRTPWSDITVCASGANSTGFGMRYVRVSIAPELPNVGPGTPTSALTIPGATLLIASTYAGVDACPTYTWSVGNWGPCTDPCEAGTQTRHAVCMDSRGVSVAQGLCPLPVPAQLQVCNNGPCKLVPGDWGECNAPCRVASKDALASDFVQSRFDLPNGWQYRPMRCLNKGGVGAQVPDGYCGSEADFYTVASQPCRGFECAVRPTYIDSNWGPCSAPCGGGIQARTITCGAYLAPDPSIKLDGDGSGGKSGLTFAAVYDLVYGDPDNPNGKTFVETQWCDALGLTRDVTVQACNTAPCAAPEVTVTYADVRALHPLSPINSSVASLVVPAGSRRYFSLPLEADRPLDLGICISVEAFDTASGKFPWTTRPRDALETPPPLYTTPPNYVPPTCSEKALADLGSCARALDYCLWRAQGAASASSPYFNNYYQSYIGLLPGRAPNAGFGGIANFRGTAASGRVCDCYAEAQRCMAARPCTPAPWQRPFAVNATRFVSDACMASVCGNATACAELTPAAAAAANVTVMRENATSIHIYASWQVREGSLRAGGVLPHLYAPTGVLPSSRANSDLAAVPVGFYTSLPLQGLPIQAAEIPRGAYGLIFSVASPSGGFAGILTASLLRPDVNATFFSDLYGERFPDRGLPVQLTGNLSDGALFNSTRFFYDPMGLPDARGQPARPNVTSPIPSYSWNDTNVAAGGLTMLLNLSCGAFVDPDVAGAGRPGHVHTGGRARQGMLAGFYATRLEETGGTPPLAAVSAPGVTHGWDSVKPFLLNVSEGFVSYKHMSNLATITLPSLEGTGYLPSADEVLHFTIPGHLMTSGRDLPVPRFRIRVNATLGAPVRDCLVGAWGAWTGCSVGFLGTYQNPPPTCGMGSQVRARAVLQAPRGGRACPATVQSRPCDSCNPCALVQCFNGGACIAGACVCGVGYGGADCSSPPPQPIVCRATQVGNWTSCTDQRSFGISNRTLACPCYDGSLAARGRAPSAPLPLYPVPADSASPTPSTTVTQSGSTTPSFSNSISDSSTPTPTATLTTGVNASDSPTPTLTATVSPTASFSPTFTAYTGTSSGTGTMSRTSSSSYTPSETATKTLGTLSRSPPPSATRSPNASAPSNFTWAPTDCGNVPVPVYQMSCPLGPRNATSVQAYIAVPNLNASVLLAHVNVWDAWSAAFLGQLTDYMRVPRAQVRMLHATACPPPPKWLGQSPQAYYEAVYRGYYCLQVEFVESPSTAARPPLGPGLTVLTFLYRLAAAIGARGPPDNMGDYAPQPLGSAGGATPQTYLLTPLWQNSWGLSADQLMGIATWQLYGTDALPPVPGGPAAPTIVPGQPLPGRINGRLADLGGIQPTNGVPAPPQYPNFIAMSIALAALGGALLFFFTVVLPAVRYGLSARAPRPERHKAPRRGSSLPERPEGLNDGLLASTGRMFWASGAYSKVSTAGGGGGGAGAANAAGSGGVLGNLIAMNPLNVLGGRGRGAGGEGGAGGSSSGSASAGAGSSSSGSGSSGDNALPIELEGGQEVVGYNPARAMGRGGKSPRLPAGEAAAAAAAGGSVEIELPNAPRSARAVGGASTSTSASSIDFPDYPTAGGAV